MSMSKSPGIAGVKAPAFIERWSLERRIQASAGIAGVKAPAFIERALHVPDDDAYDVDCGGEGPRLH